MPEPGKIVKIPVQRIEREISMLDYQGIEVPLTLAELPSSAEEGDLVEVFINMVDGELVATSQLPEVQVGSIGRVKVNHIGNRLAFANIGLERDFVIPEDYQLFPLRAGQFCHVTMIYDHRKDQLILTTKLDDVVERSSEGYKENDPVEIDIWMMDKVGSRVIVDNERWGFLPNNECIFQIKKGDHLKAWIKEIKGKNLIVSLQEEESARIEQAKTRILAMLEQHNGYIRLNDKTPPDEIQLRLRMSKKTFKKALGMLMKAGKVVQTPRAIKLAKKTES